jgi:hypothetical protein
MQRLILLVAMVLVLASGVVAQVGDQYTMDIRSAQSPAALAPINPNQIDGTMLDVLSVANGTSGNARAPIGTFRYERVAYLIRASELTAAGFPIGNVNGIGFTYSTGPNISTTGNLTVYLENTSDVTYTKGTTWSTIISSMTTAHNASLTLPATAGVVDIPFSGGSSFSYTGGGIYVAFEYSNPSGSLSTSAVVSCNTDLVNGLAGGQSNTSLESIPIAASSFRPLTRLGTESNDFIKIPVVYALGKIPIPYGVPQTITVPVQNVSASLQTLDVTLTVKEAVSGSVRFTDTQTGVSIPAGTTSIVSFAPWSPTLTENDSIIVTTSELEGEDITFNNTARMVQNVNSNRFSYSQGLIPTGGVGFNGASGDFVAKFVSGTSAVIDSIQVNFSAGGQPYKLGIWDATGPGGAPGTNLFTSSTLTSATGVVTMPVGPVAVNGFFYLGVKQTGTTNVSFSYQSENPIRPSSFYFTSPSGGTSWTDFSPGNPFRFMIEANIAPGFPMEYTSSTTTQNANPVFPGATGAHIIGMQVVTTGNLLPLNVTQFNLNTNGTTNTADISNAKVWYTGNSSTFATTTQFGSTVVSPSGSYNVTGSQALLGGTNYFWLTYDIAAGATLDNHIDAECTSITVDGTPQTPTVTAPAGFRTVKSALAAGDYTVGLALFNQISGRSVYAVHGTRRVMREVFVPFNDPSEKHSQQSRSEQTAVNPRGRTELREVDEAYTMLMENGEPCTGRLFAPVTKAQGLAEGMSNEVVGVYPTITAALGDLNSLGVSGPVRFLLIDASYPSETYPLTINVTANVPNSTNTVTIKPATGVSSTISGSMASGPIFKIVNTNYITIDGSNTNGGSTRDLTISNASTTAPNVILIGSLGVTPIANTTITNCELINGAISSSAVVISDGTTIGSAGYFSNIAVQNNSIQKAYIGVYANGGTTPQHGSNLSYIGNSLNAAGANAIRLVGLYMQGVDGATVRGNNIGNFDGLNAEDDRGMWIASGSMNVVIDKNEIHHLQYADTLGYGAYGISVSTGVTGANVLVKNNMIHSISGDGWDYTSSSDWPDNPMGMYLYGTQTGIKVYNNSINLYGNTLNQTNAMSIGIALGTGTVADIRNNVIVNNLGRLSSLGYGSAGVYAQSANSQFSPINYNDYLVNPSGLGVKALGQISTSASTTIAAWRTASGGEVNGVSGDPLYVSNTNLHITNPASLASNAGVTLADVTDDFDGDPRAGTPDIGADEFTVATANINVALTSGWNMIANPVNRDAETDSVRQLYPTSSFAYAFKYVVGSGYAQEFTMANRTGYWGKFPSAGSASISGGTISSDVIPVLAGWNMIGSISSPVDTSTITSTPAGIRQSNWFGYSGGYFPSAQITPGKAYWVKASQAGSFTFTGSSAVPDRISKSEDAVEFSSVSITDAAGNSQTLYFGADRSGKVAVAMYEMPPVAPEGIFDARFITQEGGYMLQVHPAEVQKALHYSIAIRSAVYPLIVSWNVVSTGSQSYTLTDAVQGRLLGEQTVSGVGQMRIENAAVTRLELRVEGGSVLPSEFALYQNYPNPFNPTTSIKLALPIDGEISVAIYNVLGQKVRSLLNEERKAGYHTVQWNGTDDNGVQVTSGVYFVRFAAHGAAGAAFSDVKKLMLVK